MNKQNNESIGLLVPFCAETMLQSAYRLLILEVFVSVFTPHHLSYYGDKFKEDEKGRECSTFREDLKCGRGFCGETRGKGNT